MVFRTGHLGDTVCAIPAFRLIRQSFPRSHLTLLCDESPSRFVAATEVIRELGIFDRVRRYRSQRGWRSMVGIALRVWQARPELLIILPQARETPDDLRSKIAFLRRCGVKDVRGRQELRPPNDWQPNEPARLLGLLGRMGVGGGSPGYGILPNASVKAAVKAKLSASNLDPGRPIVLFCGGGKSPSQRWPLDRYGAVLASVEQRFKVSILAVGANLEFENYRKEILPVFPNLKFLAAPVTIFELFALCQLAGLYLGNDTGPMHVAAAAGCPVAAIVSARNPPGAWDPDVKPALVIRHRTFCEDCFLQECIAEKHRCMNSISPERVLRELLPFVENLPAFKQ